MALTSRDGQGQTLEKMTPNELYMEARMSRFSSGSSRKGDCQDSQGQELTAKIPTKPLQTAMLGSLTIKPSAKPRAIQNASWSNTTQAKTIQTDHILSRMTLALAWKHPAPAKKNPMQQFCRQLVGSSGERYFLEKRRIQDCQDPGSVANPASPHQTRMWQNLFVRE